MFRDLTLLLVADDPLARGGLVALLPDEVLVLRAMASDGDVVAAAGQLKPEVVLWDAVDDVPQALDLGVPVVVLVPSAEDAAGAWSAGAEAVLLRDVVAERLAAALVAVRAGLRVDDHRLPAPKPALRDEGPTEALTPREAEVLELLAEGRSNKEIGLALEISSHTAKFHVDRLLAKLDASGRTDAVVRAVRLGLLRL